MRQTDWKHVLGWGSENMDDLRAVAYTYIRQGVYEVALTFFSALVVLDRLNRYDLQTLGALYLQLGKGEEALHYLNWALKLEPTHLPTQLNRAKALFMTGDKSRGIAQAASLARHTESKEIADQAAALLLAHRP